MDQVKQLENGRSGNRRNYNDLSLEERIRIVEGIRIYHPDFIEGFDYIHECREDSKVSSEPHCMLVIGPSGVGKSSLRNEYVRRYQREYKNRTHNKLNIFSTKVPSPITVKTFAEKLLKEIGDRFPQAGNTQQKTQRLIKYIKSAGVELIFLDEFQHFIDPNKQRDTILYDVADWFKGLIDETGIPFVMLGLDSSTDILKENEQLGGRFGKVHELTPFEYGSPEEVETFRRVLYEIDKNLPFELSSNLADPEFSDRIHYSAKGLMRATMKLISRGAKNAIQKNHPQIEMLDFAESYEYFYRYTRKDEDNPFLVSTSAYEDLIVVEEE
jgi:predicted AAA+ superfamily ATPase